MVFVTATSAPLRSDDGKGDVEEPEPTDNPYAAPKGLTAEQLTKYIEKLQRKPKTIRRRPQFIEAVVEAAERTLSEKATAEQETYASLTLLSVLHEDAVLGNDKSDLKLMEWAEKLGKSEHEKVAHLAGLHLIEKKVMDYRKGDQTPEKTAALIAELQAFLAKETLGREHLRLASEAIGLINSIEDLKERNKLFDEFGNLMIKSEDSDIARYGRRIMKKSGPAESELVGKELEIDGLTVDGVPFDWKSYRGKVVLIDFWATWCGPCRAELPNVKDAYEKYHSKGFDVVGISLDNEKDDLQQFINEQQLPWVNLFDDASKGWENPLAKKYNIRAIPATFLVGKDGKVVASNVRGPALAQALEQLLGENAEAPEKKPAEKPAEKPDEK